MSQVDDEHLRAMMLKFCEDNRINGDEMNKLFRIVSFAMNISAQNVVEAAKRRMLTAALPIVISQEVYDSINDQIQQKTNDVVQPLPENHNSTKGSPR